MPFDAPRILPEPHRVLVRAYGFELHGGVWDAGGRAHVLLLHGLGGNSVTWHGVGPTLSEALEARVLVVDLPGFGYSHPAGKPVNFNVLVDVVLTILREQAPPGTRWLIAGNSLGGALALRAACLAPEHIARVSLGAMALPLAWGRTARGFASFAGSVVLATPGVGRRLVARYARTTGVPGVVDDPVRELFGDATRLDPVLRERLIAVSASRFDWADEAARAYEQTIRSLGIQLLSPSGVARSVERVQVPVQAIHGTRDPLYPTAAWNALQRKRPDWRFDELEGVGHVPQLEAPAEYTRCLLRWLGT
jgi:pimeloyl-ACP methyl ester carboxylesterase